MPDKQPEIVFEKIALEVDSLCSYNICRNDHKWRVQLAVTKCKGCDSEIIARRLVNCPVCNEPTERSEIRLDHLAGGMSVMPLCRGAERTSQVDVIVLNRQAETFEAALPKELINETSQSNS